MQKYNKAIGAIIGGLVALGAAYLGAPDAASAPETTALINGLAGVIGGLFGTYVAPKNKY